MAGFGVPPHNSKPSFQSISQHTSNRVPLHEYNQLIPSRVSLCAAETFKPASTVTQSKSTSTCAVLVMLDVVSCEMLWATVRPTSTGLSLIQRARDSAAI